MGGGHDLRSALEEVRAVDHHAHLLGGEGAGIELVEILTESTDPAQFEHVREHPAFVHGMAELGAFLGIEATERALAQLYEREGVEAVAGRLLEACGFQAMLVDDGYRFDGALALEDQAKVAGCAVHRVARIESLAQEAASGWPGFGSVRERFRAAVEEALGESVGFKTIAAYRSGLDLPDPDPDEARRAYERWRESDSPRVTHPALVSFFLSETLHLLRRRPVPVQVHTGMGDTDLALHRANPSLLRPVFEDRRNARVPFVLLHCYPFVGEASYLASVYPNVFLDISLATTFAVHRGADLVLQALDLAPASKLLFATDASRRAELFFLGARWWRDALAGALGRLVQAGTIDQRTALRWGEMVLAGNARKIYPI